MLDICIPTLTPYPNLANQVACIADTTQNPYRLIASCQKACAATNRNFCLRVASGNIIVMLDDDIEGFYPGWDRDLIGPLLHDPDICLVSARPIRHDGQPGRLCCGNVPLTPELVEVKPRRDCVLPSAAIAFRNLGFQFDESFVGSGWEDNDFCFQYIQDSPHWKFVINNGCRLVHRNEMKNQWDGNFEKNREYFYSKWGLTNG